VYRVSWHARLHGPRTGPALMSIKSRYAMLFCIVATSSLLNICRSEPLRLYNCPEASRIEQANSCPAGCKDMTSSAGYFEILVDKSSRSVMQVSKLLTAIEVNGKTLPRGHTLTSEIFESCKIFDKKNWDCSKTDKAIEVSQLGINLESGEFRRMTDGVYRSYLWITTSDRRKKILSADCLVPFNR